jgi:hypothetical protein
MFSALSRNQSHIKRIAVRFDGETRAHVEIKGGTEAVIYQDRPGRPIYWNLKLPDGAYHPAATDPRLRSQIATELRDLAREID